MTPDPGKKELFVPASAVLNVCPQCGRDAYHQSRHAREDEILHKLMSLLVDELSHIVTPNSRQVKMKSLLNEFANIVTHEEEAKDIENDARKAKARLEQLEKELADGD